MLQNRVDPFGDIIKTSARGAWLGNRGQLHGSGKTILRRFKHKAWITCLLKFKGRRRQVMSPNLWTELFFLDEATAFAAGHRPCFECRRDDADRFKAAWLKGNPAYGFDRRTSVNEIDAVLQSQRIDRDNRKVSFESELNDLPDGTFISFDNEPCLVWQNLLHHWTPFGYNKTVPLSFTDVSVLTPASTVNAFRSGYRPQVAVSY